MIGVGQQLRRTYDDLADTHPPSSSSHVAVDRKQEIFKLATQLRPLQLFSNKDNRKGHGAFPHFFHSDDIPNSNEMCKTLADMRAELADKYTL